MICLLVAKIIEKLFLILKSHAQWTYCLQLAKPVLTTCLSFTVKQLKGQKIQKNPKENKVRKKSD